MMDATHVEYKLQKDSIILFGKIILHVSFEESKTKFFSSNLQKAANKSVLKCYNRNIRERCEICSKLTIKMLEQRQWHRYRVFTVKFIHISHPFYCFYYDFKQTNVYWDIAKLTEVNL